MSSIAAEKSGRSNFLSVLRRRNFALLWSGQAISLLGDALFAIAEIWLVLQLTGSAVAMGTTVILTQLPRLALMMIGGVSVDRYDRRMMMLISDLIRGGVVFMFGYLVATNQIQLWHVYVLAIIFGVVSAFFQPAQSAVIPNLVPRDSLTAATALSQLTMQVAQVFGPLLGGILIALPAVGIAGVCYLNAASFLIGALGIAFIQMPAATNGARKTNNSMLTDLRDGLRYLFGFRALVIILLLAMVLNFSLAPLQVLMPIHAQNALGQGSEGFGLLLTMLGVGMVAGSIFVGVWSPNRRRGLWSFALCAVGGAFFIVIGLVPIFALTLAMLFVFGFLNAIINAMLGATMQGIIADEFRGRVAGVNMTIATGLNPIALALGGVMGDAFGAGIIIAAGGVLCALTALGGLGVREIRELQ
ncbi:MAG: MFS transporter [Chloroflexi bacterium]|nr:MFS transporter [Chloroflexota bacterium]